MAGQEGLGRLYDLSVADAVLDLSAGPTTGKLVSMRNFTGLAVVVYKGAASAGTDPGFTFKESQDSSGTGKQAMATPPTHFYKKSAASLAGTETWTKVACTASSGSITLTGEEGNQGIYVFEIMVSQLSDGFPYVSVDANDAGTVAQLGGVLYLLHDPEQQHTPANLKAALS